MPDYPASPEQLLARIGELEAQLARHDLERACFAMLSTHMAEGFCVLELFDGPHGPLSDYRYILSNDACLRHTGHDKQMGQTVRELIPDEADAWVPRFAEVLRTGQSTHFEQRLKISDRLLSISAHRLGRASDRRVAVLFTGVPASQQARDLLYEQAEKRMDRAETNSRLLGELVDHSLANVFAADCSLRLVAINRTARETFERLHGISPKVGDHVREILAGQPQIMEKFQPLWPRVIAGESFIEMVSIGPPDAPRHYEMRYNPLRDAEGQICGGYLFAYDITSRVLEQERLSQAEEALRQSQKMEAIGQLTGGIAHDFNNLLGGIVGALELADKRMTQGRQQDSRHMLGIARQNTSRATALVQRLLAFARQQALVPQPVDAHHLVADMHDLIHSSLDRHIEYVDATLAGQWLVCVDPSQLESTLLNLCINARDAMTQGGTLRISSANCQMDAAQAASLQLPAGQYLHIQVEDNGCGMPQEISARAAEPFFTTKPLGQGTGLGLSMAYGFVRQSAGQLSIDSAPGHGTCIHLYLPRGLPGSTPQADDTEQMIKPSSTGQSLILLVEDQTTLRLVMREVLEEHGFQVQDYEDGHTVLHALAEGIRPDMLVVDIGLPGDLDGYQVANACWAIDEHVPALFITGYDGAIDNSRISGSPPIALLHKPFELTRLTAKVEELLIAARSKPA